MFASLRPIVPALASAGLLMVGTGLLSTVISLRLDGAHGGPTGTGAVLAAYYVGVLAGARWCASLIRRVGAVPAFAALCTVNALAALSHGFIAPVFGWLLLRAVYGGCLAGIFMLVESWLCQRAGPGSLGWVVAFYIVVVQASVGVGQLVLPAVGVVGLRPFVAASLLLFLAPLPLLRARRSAPAAPGPGRLRIGALASRTPLSVAAAGASGVVTGALVTLSPVLGRSLGLSLSQLGWFVGALALGGAVLQMPLGRASDLLGRPTVLAVSAAGLFATSSALWIGPRGPVGPGAYLTMALLGGFAFALYPQALAHANDVAQPHERVDVSGGLLAVWAAAAALGPLVGSWLMSGLGARALVLVTGLAGAGLLAFQAVRYSARVGRHRQRVACLPVSLPHVAPRAPALVPSDASPVEPLTDLRPDGTPGA